MNPLRVGDIWRYKGGEVNYTIIHTGLMKYAIDWIPCVVYQSNATQEIFVREQSVFLEKFTQIPGETEA